MYSVLRGGGLILTGDEFGILLGEDYYTEEQKKELFKVWDELTPFQC